MQDDRHPADAGKGGGHVRNVFGNMVDNFENRVGNSNFSHADLRFLSGMASTSSSPQGPRAEGGRGGRNSDVNDSNRRGGGTHPGDGKPSGGVPSPAPVPVQAIFVPNPTYSSAAPAFATGRRESEDDGVENGGLPPAANPKGTAADGGPRPQGDSAQGPLDTHAGGHGGPAAPVEAESVRELPARRPVHGSNDPLTMAFSRYPTVGRGDGPVTVGPTTLSTACHFGSSSTEHDACDAREPASNPEIEKGAMQMESQEDPRVESSMEDQGVPVTDAAGGLGRPTAP